ncbi:hypothetical protein NDU88_004391 [Pleurodeles waltl]|uniref:Uncharacterized protein n=1 Tax=Pleurodeles waltl TaxID=8319 RepID=A0AAV7VG34_PLEWA|nr:hypothetical protein NDU88_004391 [Pleurodeles waltl]
MVGADARFQGQHQGASHHKENVQHSEEGRSRGVEPQLLGEWLLGDVSPMELMLKRDTGRRRKTPLLG